MRRATRTRLTPREWARRLGGKYRYWRGAAHRAGVTDEAITEDRFRGLFEDEPAPEPSPAKPPEKTTERAPERAPDKPKAQKED